MRGITFSVVFGYLVGSLSPAAFLSMLKQKDLKENGTGNLGATNTMLVFGKKYGIIVMIFDILKAFFSVQIAKIMFRNSVILGLLAGCCAVVGHIFPFYLNFSGGKGLAAFGGMVLAYDPMLFLVLLFIGISLMLLTNYGVALPVSAALLLPFLAFVRSGNFIDFSLLLVVGCLIIFKHIENIEKARNGTEIKVREYIKEKLFAEEKEDHLLQK